MQLKNELKLIKNNSDLFSSTRIVYMRCRLPLETTTQIFRVSGRCKYPNKSMTVRYKPSNQKQTIEYIYPFKDNEKHTLYFIDEMMYSKKNKISFDTDTCDINISDAKIHFIHILFVMISIFTHFI